MVPPSVPAGDPVARATRLADDLLRPSAEQVDRSAVPRSHLDAWAAQGLLGLAGPRAHGGAQATAAVQREVAAVMAGACGATWFVATQHTLPVTALAASPNDALRARRLAALCSGELLSGVAFSHLRRPGPPAVLATRGDGGWRFDGAVSWMTGWGLCDVLLLAGRTEADEVVFVLVEAREQPGLTASAPLALAAMGATRTVALALDDLRVDDADVVEIIGADAWLAADALRTGERLAARLRPAARVRAAAGRDGVGARRRHRPPRSPTRSGRRVRACAAWPRRCSTTSRPRTCSRTGWPSGPARWSWPCARPRRWSPRPAAPACRSTPRPSAWPARPCSTWCRRRPRRCARPSCSCGGTPVPDFLVVVLEVDPAQVRAELAEVDRPGALVRSAVVERGPDLVADAAAALTALAAGDLAARLLALAVAVGPETADAEAAGLVTALTGGGAELLVGWPLPAQLPVLAGASADWEAQGAPAAAAPLGRRRCCGGRSVGRGARAPAAGLTVGVAASLRHAAYRGGCGRNEDGCGCRPVASWRRTRRMWPEPQDDGGVPPCRRQCGVRGGCGQETQDGAGCRLLRHAATRRVCRNAGRSGLPPVALCGGGGRVWPDAWPLRSAATGWLPEQSSIASGRTGRRQASDSATSYTSSLTSSCAGAGSSRSDVDHGRSVRSSRHHRTEVARIENAEAAV
jgi:hypothetical protein